MPAIGAIVGRMDDRQAPPGELRWNYTSVGQVGQVVLLVHGFGTPLLLGFGHSHVLLARLNKLHAINLRA
ncbi:GM22201 [Drosophila sechellia]|uniref:GM22201 n=1 Tax=Drosophila sechellia TaxID=7238 RepID=B4IAD4_DROSE|nr:GM22201 [Drosophila sechellia]